MTTTYTFDDLEKARADFEHWQDLWSREFSMKKPNKYDPEFSQAAKQLRAVEGYLKLVGLLAYTDDELAQETLNEKYPNAKSRDIVKLNGVRYQKRFIPKKRSKTGKTVKEWHTFWENLDAD